MICTFFRKEENTLCFVLSIGIFKPCKKEKDNGIEIDVSQTDSRVESLSTGREGVRKRGRKDRGRKER